MVDKIKYISDIHINKTKEYFDIVNSNYSEGSKKLYIKKLMETYGIKQGNHLNEIGATIYIINGDISKNKDEIDWFVNKLKKTFKGKVYRTVGNHCLSKNYSLKEYINLDFDGYLPTNPIILEDKVIIGNSGFFDFSYSERFNDLYYIQNTLMLEVSNRYFKNVNITYSDVREILPNLLKNTKKQIDLIDFKNKKKIYITHYVPHKDFLVTNDYTQDSKRIAYMGSNKIHNFLLKNDFDVCYFGHTHKTIKKIYKDKIEYNCAPLGTILDLENDNCKEMDYISIWKSKLVDIV